MKKVTQDSAELSRPDAKQESKLCSVETMVWKMAPFTIPTASRILIQLTETEGKAAPEGRALYFCTLKAKVPNYK